MTTYLIPTDTDFVEFVSKAIARRRIHDEAAAELEASMGVSLEDHTSLEDSFDDVFESLWGGNTSVDVRQRQNYREDAIAAINAINLKLLSTP